jgi:hypothetical protein
VGALIVFIQVSMLLIDGLIMLTAEATWVSDGKTLGLNNLTFCNQNKQVAFFPGLAFKK